MTDLESYFEQIARIPLLTADEEKALAQRIQAGDLEARNQLVSANLRLVVYCLRTRLNRTRRVPLEDLIQEGNRGLLAASQHFDPAHGCRFSTYAYYWIRRFVQHALRNQADLIRVPDNVQQERRRRGQSLLHLRVLSGSWQRPAARHGLQEAEDTQADPAEKVLQRDRQAVLRARIEEALQFCDRKAQQVIRMRWGLDDGQEKTLAEIGRRLGFSRERARQLEARGMAKFRERLGADAAAGV